MAVELYAVRCCIMELSHLLDSNLHMARLHHDWRIGLRLRMANTFDDFSTESGTSLAQL